MSFGIQIRATCLYWLVLFIWNTVRIRPGIVTNAGDLPRDLPVGSAAGNLEAIALHLARDVQARLGRSHGSKLVAKIAIEGLEIMVLAQKHYFDAEKMPAFSVATSYARMGDKEQALRYLRTSFRRHEVAFLAIRVHEALVNLHGDSAFRQLVAQAGLPPLS